MGMISGQFITVANAVGATAIVPTTAAHARPTLNCQWLHFFTPGLSGHQTCSAALLQQTGGAEERTTLEAALEQRSTCINTPVIPPLDWNNSESCAL